MPHCFVDTLWHLATDLALTAARRGRRLFYRSQMCKTALLASKIAINQLQYCSSVFFFFFPG